MFKDFPSLHPLVIHFPIVLILLAAAFQAVAVWKPDWVQIRWAAVIIMSGGFFGSLLASTVFHAMIAPDAPKEAIAIFEAHEEYAQYTLWMSGITLLLKGIGVFFKLHRRSYEGIVLASAVVSAIFLSIAGHHGARLTHVAGVGPQGKYLMEDHGAGGGHHGNGMEGMDMKGDSTMHGSDSLQDMKNMPGMDSAKSMEGMKGMENMKGMEGMDHKRGQGMEDMPGMNNSSKDNKSMKGMKGMEGMPGMNNNNKDMKNMKEMQNMKGMDTMKGMDNMKGMKDKDLKGMENMPGMEKMNDMKNMPGMDTAKGMKGMEGMDDMKGMEGMDGMKGMPGMKNMKGAKLIDPSKPYDNNPAREKKSGGKKQE